VGPIKEELLVDRIVKAISRLRFAREETVLFCWRVNELRVDPAHKAVSTPVGF
jgi:hypothetical protein